MNGLASAEPPGAFLPGLALAFAVGLLLGVERGLRLRDEEAGARDAGIRTLALLGLLGGLAALGGAAGGRSAGWTSRASPCASARRR